MIRRNLVFRSDAEGNGSLPSSAAELQKIAQNFHAMTIITIPSNYRKHNKLYRQLISYLFLITTQSTHQNFATCNYRDHITNE